MIMIRMDNSTMVASFIASFVLQQLFLAACTCIHLHNIIVAATTCLH